MGPSMYHIYGANVKNNNARNSGSRNGPPTILVSGIQIAEGNPSRVHITRIT
jgi:hypothetical protein